MKTTKKTILEVDYNELDKSINEFLKEKGIKGEFEVVADEELNNDSQKSFLVDGKEDEFFLKYDLPDIKKGKFSFKTGTILNWMCIEGKIEAGEYIVDICW